LPGGTRSGLKSPGPNEPPEPPLDEHVRDDDGKNIIRRMERIPEAFRQFDALASPGEEDGHEEISGNGLRFDDPAPPDGVKVPPDPPLRHDQDVDPGEDLYDGPAERPKRLLDDPPSPQSEPLTDEELMRLLGLDDGNDEPSSWGIEFDTFPSDDGPDAAEPADAVVAPYNNRSLESLIDDLGSAEAEVRGRAAGAVVAHGTDAVPLLIGALARADDRRRWCIAEALSLIGGDAITALIAALGDAAVQSGAAATLVRMGEPAVPPLIAALASGDEEVQFGARYALREIGDAAVPSLVEALDAPEGSIRRSAASVLKETGWMPPDDAGTIRYLIAGEAWLDVAAYGEAAVDPLIRLLKSRDREIWWNAARTLGEVGEPAVDPLVRLLHETDDEVRPFIGMALVETGFMRSTRSSGCSRTLLSGLRRLRPC
jgi:hypothetical protein